MKTFGKKSLVKSVLVVAVASLALALATEASAQGVVYCPSGPVVYQGPTHYCRVYQGTSWHWTWGLGWHTHNHYINVPHWTPQSYIYQQPPYVYAVTRHSH